LVESSKLVDKLRVELSSAETSNSELSDELSETSRQLQLLNTELRTASLQNTSMAHEVRMTRPSGA